MPRQRQSSSSQEKRCSEAENEGSSPKRVRTAEDDSKSHINDDVTDDVIDNRLQTLEEERLLDATNNNAETVNEEFQAKGDNSSDEKEESEIRERSLSSSSSTEQRNRSLEALFQVTDTELQAISKQAPDGHHVIQIDEDGHSETLYVIDSAIQEREELVEEAEVITEGIDCIDTTADESNDDSDEPRTSRRKNAVDSVAMQASTSTEGGEVIDTPKWRQFKNIERILQKAGIDTSSKTWQTLTRPGRHICPYCQRACTKPSVLEKHIRAHTGERPYPCLVCGFAFKTKSNLYKHCKSRAHTLKTNVEAKKLRVQSLSNAEGEEISLPTIVDNDNTDNDKKTQMEPAQRHVIQEVVKYLEKDKGQRPNEVQTERQRAKLERLKSMQEKGIGDVRKRDDSKGIHRQLSLPVMSTNIYGKGSSQQFQRIAPKGVESPENVIGSLNNMPQILIPGTVFLNEKGEVLQTVQRMESVEQNTDQSSTETDQMKASDDTDSSFYNQIEIVNLPNPDTDPETSTKALRDLEELSEKFSAAAQDGLRLSTSVHSLPDKRVQVVLQLQRPVKKSADSVIENVSSQANVSSPRSALKERIQRLISANAAIVDTPKVEPPRAKCIKCNLSRQDSESWQMPRSEIEAAVSGLVMPNINSIPLQPLPQDNEHVIHQSNGKDDVIPDKNIIVEKIDCLNEDVLVIQNDELEENDCSKLNMKAFEDLDKNVSSKGKIIDKDSQVVGIANIQKGGTKGDFVSGKGVREGLQLSIASALSTNVLKDQLNQSGSASYSHKHTSSVIMSPIVTSANKSTVPGNIGKIALKNLQMRSKSLSSLNVSSSPSTPVVMVTQPSFSTQYMLQTPTTPVAQVMMPGSSVPVLLLSGTSGTTLQQFPPTMEQRPTMYVQQMIQPGILPTGSQVVNVLQATSKTPTSQFTSVIPGQTFIVEQNVPQASHSQPVITAVPLSQKTGSLFSSQVMNPPVRNIGIQSPLVMTSSQSDPMKILSSIVSNTVKNNPNVTQTSTSQPKEIKIEIKLPPPSSLGVVQPVSTVQQRLRPPLKRQSPVSSLNSPSLSGPPSLGLQKPVFRFQNLSPNLIVQNKFCPPNQSAQYRFQVAGSKGTDIVTSSTTTNKVPQSSVIKEYLLRKNSFDANSKKHSNASENETQLFHCQNCHIAFKKKETLDLHNLCYCKGKISTNAIQSSSEESFNSEIRTKIVSQLFSQSADNANNSKMVKTTTNENVTRTQTKTLTKQKAESIDVHHIKKAKFEFPLERSKSVIISPTEKKLASRTGSPVVDRTLSALKQQGTKPSKMASVKDYSDNPDTGIITSNEKPTKLVTTKKLKEMWQSKLKGQILKRKLKGKLLMNRSISLDQSLVEDPKPPSSVKIGLKTRFPELDDNDVIVPKKRPRLVRAQDDSISDSVTVKRLMFRRSKSVPELPKHVETEADEKNVSEEQIDAKVESFEHKEKEHEWQLNEVTIPIVTANFFASHGSPLKPIYQQNFRMKSFDGMGTPTQLMPSATLTPRPELMEMEKFRKTFSFESGSLKLIQNSESDSMATSGSPVKSSGVKLPIQPGNFLDNISKVSFAMTTLSPSKLSKQVSGPSPSTPQKSPLVRQFSLVAHTYPSMRSMTHPTFCCAYQLQPSYVKSGKKISMYSNWRVAQQNTNLLGLPTRALMSLYNSKYTTNPVWVMNCGEDPRSGAITHSSYWKIKNGETNFDTVFSLLEVKDFKKEKEKSKFEVGYKTTEESVYVRGRGRGKYVCETCGIRCKKPSMLKKHIRTHTDLRPYKCKHCRFSFKTKGNLQKHMKSKSHYKKCLDIGISPVPTTVDESQIDEEALQAQCYLSKRAKIVDKMADSSQMLDRDISTTDDNDDDDDDGDEEEDYKIVDDGDEEVLEPMDENSDIQNESSSVDGKELETDEKLDLKETMSDQVTVTTTESQHNLFLQSLGIIAKHRLSGDKNPISQTGSKSLQLPMVKNLGISLESINQLGSASSQSSAGTVSSDSTPTSSLSTVYGNLQVESEGHPSVTKDSDVIWGLLNLSDQSNKSMMSMSMEQDSVVTTSTEFGNIVKASDVSNPTTETLPSAVTSQVKVNQSSSFLPPYLSMAASVKLKSTKSGPIIGQIIQNVTTKSNTSEISGDRAVTMPFQFQHPFPGSLGVMLASSSTDAKYSPSTCTDILTSESQSNVLSSDTEQQIKSSKDDLMYVQIGNTKGEVDTVPAQIVNVDPAVFRGRNQDSVPEKVASLPTESILQLRKVSDGLYVITTDTEIGKTGTSVAIETPSKVIVPTAVPNISSSAVHMTGTVCHVTGSQGHVTGSHGHVAGSANFVQQTEDAGRFVCNICKASFPEHHQLILHGNVHFLGNNNLKCEKCNMKFRSHSAYEKHLLSDTHNASVQGKMISLEGADPRPYKCTPCNTAFRLKGHLTKHFRSRAHFKNFEALGNLAIGTWEKVEHKVSEVDACTVEEFLAVVDRLLGSVTNQSESVNKKLWAQPEVTVVEDEVFVEDGGNERVLVEVNEQPFEIGSIGENEKYRVYPLPGVFVEEAPRVESMEIQAVPVDSPKVKPHKCGLCGRGYETVAELKTHLITHAELRPYVCEYCDAGFTNAQSLKIHLYTHTQETPYVCGMCGLKFPNTQDLSQHCKLSHPPPGHGQSPSGQGQSPQRRGLSPTGLSHVAVSRSVNSPVRSIQPLECTQTLSSGNLPITAINPSQNKNTQKYTFDVSIATESHSSVGVPVVLKAQSSKDTTNSEKTVEVPAVKMKVSEETDQSETKSNVTVGPDDTFSVIREQADVRTLASNKDYEYITKGNGNIIMMDESMYLSGQDSSVVAITTGDQSEITLIHSVTMEANCSSTITSSYVHKTMSQDDTLASSVENNMSSTSVTFQE